MVGIATADRGGSEFLVNPNASHGKDTLFVIQMEPPAVSCLSRAELALRYLIRNATSLAGTFSVYLHTIVATDNLEYSYYGITSRSPIVRFGEHLRQANAESQSLFHKALRDLVPDAKSIHHTIVAAGTFAWIGRHRRHSKDFERNPETSEKHDLHFHDRTYVKTPCSNKKLV